MATKKKTTTRIQDRFVDHDLGMAVVEAMVRQGLVTTDLCVPELKPEEDDDPDDESESWRDRIDEDALEIVGQLRALLDTHANKLARIEAINEVFLDIYEDMDRHAEIDSLAGIELCSGLKRLSLTTSNTKLDLTPLTLLPALEELDLGGAVIKDLTPLLALPRLKKLSARVDPHTLAALRERGVHVSAGDPT